VAFSLKFVKSGKIPNSAFYGTELQNLTPKFRGKIFILCDNICVYPKHHLPSKPVLGSLVRATFMNELLEGPPDSTASDVIYVPPRLTCRNSVYSPQYICVLSGSQKKSDYSLYSIILSFFIAESLYASCVVKNRSSDLTDAVSSLKWLMYQTFTYKYSTDWMR